MSRQASILDSHEVYDDADMLKATSEAQYKHRHTCAARSIIRLIVGAHFHTRPHGHRSFASDCRSQLRPVLHAAPGYSSYIQKQTQEL